ncbi:hypothetical protein ACWEIM_05970 [Streptomyces sp. NPDC004778]
MFRVVRTHMVRELSSLPPTVGQLHEEGWPTVHLPTALTRPA